MNPLFVLVGMPGAGKSTVVTHLASRQWPVVYFGGITLAEVTRRGLPSTQENEKTVRESIRAEHGPAAYALLSLPSIRHALAHSPCLVDGLYSWAEYTCLRQTLREPMYVMAVCADRKERYRRLAAREVRPLSPDEAEERDFAEIENIGKGGPIAIADFTLINNGPLEELLPVVDKLVNGILNDCMRMEATHD